MNDPDTKAALRIVVPYMLVAGLWVLFSDAALYWMLAADSERARQIGQLKDSAFVVVTALLLFVLLRRELGARRAAEITVRQSEEQLRYQASLLANVNDAIVASDASYRITAWNPAAEALYGWKAEEVIGQPSMDMLQTEFPEAEKSRMLRLIAESGRWRGEVMQVRKDGLRIDVEEAALVLRDERGQISGYVSVNRDIGERKRAEQALHESEAQYRLMFEHNPHPMWVYDHESLAFLAVNDAAMHHYGYTRDEFLAMTIKDIRPPEDVPRLLGWLGDAGPVFRASGTWRHRTKAGAIIEVDITTHAVQFAGRPARLVLAQDITERRKLEEQLRQSQKLEGIGRLAGGIAHDFNNLLTAIAGYAQLTEDSLGADDPRRADVEQILKATRRATDLTRQLLTFARKQIIAPRNVDLNELVRDTSNLLRRLIGEDVELVTILAPDLGLVTIDPGQFEQILMNLAVNARDAMPQGGKLTIETYNVALDAEYARHHADVAPGEYVLLTVSDTGIGMSEETRAQIFEPFFTTKERGQGTGLGLAVCHGIVKQVGGNIWVYSEPGQGTTFKIYLPRTQTATAPAAREEVAVPVRGGGETILLVEDEPLVRQLALRALRAQGYVVLVADSGGVALEIARRHGSAIHLLLTDVVMPGMSGKQLAAQIAAERQGIKVLYVSGYTENTIVHHGVLEAGVMFLPKPFTPSALAGKVRAVLDGE